MITKQTLKLTVNVKYADGSNQYYEFICSPYGEKVISEIEDAKLSLILTKSEEEVKQTIEIKR